MTAAATPFFSIVIPTYNRAELISLTLDSVLEQTFFDYEVLIVDDGSTDNTQDVIKRYLADQRVQCFKIKNSDRSAARNFGTGKSKGQYVTFLDSDDLFLPWHLETAYAKIVSHRHPPIFHLRHELLHTDGRITPQPRLTSPITEKLLKGNFLGAIGVFMKRNLALENAFDHELSSGEDHELWLRIVARTPILTFPEVTSRVVNHAHRGVLVIDPKRLLRQSELLEKKVLANSYFIERFGKKLYIFRCFRMLHLSLHLAISGEKMKALRVLLKCVSLYPKVVFEYRFVVVCKKIALW